MNAGGQRQGLLWFVASPVLVPLGWFACLRGTRVARWVSLVCAWGDGRDRGEDHRALLSLARHPRLSTVGFRTPQRLLRVLPARRATRPGRLADDVVGSSPRAARRLLNANVVGHERVCPASRGATPGAPPSSRDGRRTVRPGAVRSNRPVPALGLRPTFHADVGEACLAVPGTDDADWQPRVL